MLLWKSTHCRATRSTVGSGTRSRSASREACQQRIHPAPEAAAHEASRRRQRVALGRRGRNPG
eukprot:scaffold20628_cov65-Phaeocystis_antarctica.AAC.5